MCCGSSCDVWVPCVRGVVEDAAAPGDLRAEDWTPIRSCPTDVPGGSSAWFVVLVGSHFCSQRRFRARGVLSGGAVRPGSLQNALLSASPPVCLCGCARTGGWWLSLCSEVVPARPAGSVRASWFPGATSEAFTTCCVRGDQTWWGCWFAEGCPPHPREGSGVWNEEASVPNGR